MAQGGMSDATIPALDDWSAFTPAEATARLSDLDEPWYVAAGWALDLFRGGQTREHEDLEIAIPERALDAVRGIFAECDWYLPLGQGRLARLDPGQQPYGESHQTWALDRATRRWRLDVFREPERHGRWVCRRLPEVALPYDEIVMRTPGGIPFLAPEWVLLFKAKHVRPKDDADLHGVLPLLDVSRRDRLRDLLVTVHPNHRWIDTLS